MSSANIIAGYGEGAFGPGNILNNVSAVLDAGWNRLMLGLFHVNQDGNIYFNDTLMFSGGSYVGDSDWPGDLDQLVNPPGGQTGLEMIASFGGDPTSDFTNIMNIYRSTANGKKADTFAGTSLESNVNAMISTFSRIIHVVDMDTEDCYDEDSFLAFCKLFTDATLKLTAAPYTMMSWWVDRLADLEQAAPGCMVNWNLQCYSSLDQGNAPATWAGAITKKLKTFDTTNFIVAGFEPTSIAALGTQLDEYTKDASVGGAYAWTLDTIMNDTAGPSMADYVTKIQTVLG